MDKCPTCSRKVQIVAQACRCGKKFCPLHRLPENHACTYDYKTEGRKILGTAWEPQAPKMHSEGN
jgi:hypothetical protein